MTTKKAAAPKKPPAAPAPKTAPKKIPTRPRSELDTRPHKPMPKEGSGAMITSGSETFSVSLQSRHAQYLRAVAKLEQRSPEQMIERLVRIAYQQDPSGQRVNVKSGDNSFSGRRGDGPQPEANDNEE